MESRIVPATLTVNTFQDTVNAAGMLSLRDAITIVNGGNSALSTFNSQEQGQVSGTLGTSDTIVFDSGVFNVARAIDLSTSEGGLGTLTLRNNVTIQGPNSNDLTIEGGQTSGVASNAQVLRIASGFTVGLSNLVIRNGYTSGAGGGVTNAGNSTLTVSDCTFDGNAAVSGGGLYNPAFATVAIIGCTFSSNHATNGIGGGVLNEDYGTISVTDSAFTNNSATYQGGGIFGAWGVTNSTFTGNSAALGGAIFSAAYVSNCAFAGNSATQDGGAIYNNSGGSLAVTACQFTDNTAGTGAGSNGGGAIFDARDNYGAGGALTISDSTFAGNSGYNGGALWINNSPPNFTNTTFSNNVASHQGGAIFNAAGVGTIVNTTFAGNSAPTGGAIYSSGSLATINVTIANNLASSAGGGVYNAGSFQLVNALLAQNTHGDYAGNAAAGGSINNLIQVDNGSGLSNGTGGNLIGSGVTNVGLDPAGLQDNGGPTKTIAIVSGSDAMDAGTDSVLVSPYDLTADQTGAARQRGSHVDIGAYEYPASPLVTSASNATLTDGGGSFTVTATGVPTPSLSATGLADGLTFSDNADGTAFLTATTALPGTYSFTISAHNGVGGDNTQTFTLTVKPPPHAPQVIVVTTAGDSSGIYTPATESSLATDTTLRGALLYAQYGDMIVFNIAYTNPGDVETIHLSGTALPTIGNQITIDGWSQGEFEGMEGYCGAPLIVLDGSALPAGSSGLTLAADGCTVEGLAIDNFSQAGIWITSNNNVIQGNYLGTADGLTAAANGHGIYIDGGIGNRIGGTSACQGNLISGNTNFGIVILDAASANVIEGNRIGTNAAGTAALGNEDGIVLYGAAIATTIGGTASGAGNLISGNRYDGLDLIGPSAAMGTIIQGNYIGTNAAGTAALGNTNQGIYDYHSSGNTFGGAGNGIGLLGTDGFVGNLISGNGYDGLGIDTGSNNTIRGNFIGTNRTGTAAIGNYRGINLHFATHNTIGGTGAGEGNLVSGNRYDGIYVYSQFVTDMVNVIRGNYVGTDVTGMHALGNAGRGMHVDEAYGNTVGGAGTGIGVLGSDGFAGNLISGNAGVGLEIEQCNNAVVEGNFIGTDRTGTAAIGNSFGVYLSTTSGLQFGGVNAGEGNLVSGNFNDGIKLYSYRPDTGGNAIRGNYIGTDVTGTLALGNGTDGIEILNNHNIIGGAGSVGLLGSTGFAGNLISGNSVYGITAQNDTGNLIQGNFVGSNATGTGAIANSYGIYLSNATDTQIGGTNAGEGNLVSGNANDGIKIYNDTLISNYNTVQGNYVGTDRTGSIDLGNGYDGINIQNASLNTVGAASNGIGVLGADGFAGNLISGNNNVGIEIGSNSTLNTIQGNFIGTDRTGGSALGNYNGIQVLTGANTTTMGGTAAGQGNLVSGNNYSGIQILAVNSNALNNVVQGNYIGTDASGSYAIANADHGVYIYHGYGNTIGGASNGIGLLGMGAFAGNLISGNSYDGIGIDTGSNNIIQGNFIGTDRTGSAAIGNHRGINLHYATGNQIGGTAAGQGNLVSGNRSDGVYLYSQTALNMNDVIQGNYIGTDATGAVAVGNAAAGILLDNAYGNQVGGASAGIGVLGSDGFVGNLVSGNGGNGIHVTQANSNVLQGNFVGTDRTGTKKIANAGGIFLDTSSSTTVGGSAAGQGNLISGNTGDGFGIHSIVSSNLWNVVQGNYIGTDVSGTLALGNGNDGVNLQSANTNTIGGTGGAVIGVLGTDAFVGNLISSNGHDGVEIGGTSTLNQIEGNIIGADRTGLAARGNTLAGVYIASAAANSIGGTTTGAGNIIANNGGSGVAVVGTTATHNAIEGNSIFANAGLGIDLNNDGVTPNHSGGPVSGPNGLLNYPVLNYFLTGTRSSVSGSLNGAANVTYRLEFFANSTADPSGHGEGQTYLGFINVTTDGTGNVSFSSGSLNAAPVGSSISATATDPNGNTSEFSANVVASQAMADTTATASYAITQGVSFRSMISQSGTFAAGTYTIGFDAAMRGNFGTAQSFQVLVDDNVIDTYTVTSTAYLAFVTDSFTLTAGSHTVAFRGLVRADVTTFIDHVQVNSAPTALLDGGFETPAIGNFQYNPTGSPWTFLGTTGVSANNGSFTDHNPPAPDGRQVAFLQGSSEIPLATFIDASAASSSDFSVQVDWGGTVIGTPTVSVVNVGGSNWSVNGSVIYANAGTYPVSVSITDNVTHQNLQISGKVQLVAAAQQVSVSAPTATATESGTDGRFRVTRTIATSDLTVALTLDAASTALLQTDYTLAGNGLVINGNTITVVIPNGQLSTDIVVHALSDGPAAEAAESVGLDLGTGTGYSVGSPAQATVTIAASGTVVTNANDHGDGSLRQAILNANVVAGAQTITFDPTFFNVARTIALQSELPDLTDTTGSTIIDGPGADLLTLDGQNGDYRIFDINSGATVTLEGLTLTHGLTSADGGAVRNAGTLFVNDCVISNNSAAQGGGGLANARGQVTVTDTIIRGNTGGNAGGGGGVSNTGSMSLVNSTITQNVVSVGWLISGGGIFNQGTLSLIGCSVTDNTGAFGAGIFSGHSNQGTILTILDSTLAYNNGRSGVGIWAEDTVTISNSTLAHNSASNSGAGAIYHAGGDLTLTNVTISLNSCSDAGGVGGISTVGGSTTLTNSILAGNTQGDYGDYYRAYPLTATSTIISNDLGGESRLTSGVNGNIIGVSVTNVGLDPAGLQDNGGPTQTIALLSGSQAIAAGSNSVLPSTDQRGAPRFLGHVDIGAYQSVVVPSSSVSALPVSSGNTFTVSWAGSDDAGGSGLASFDIYASDNGGAYTLWQSNTTQTSATFSGTLGHTYGFYSVARDAAGNVEAPPASADAMTMVTSFQDGFTTAGNLDSAWTIKKGSFTVNGSQQAVAGMSSPNVAVLSGVTQGDGSQSVTVTNLTPGQFAALVARYQGSGDSGMYQAGVRNTAGTLTAEIYKNVGGTWTALTIVSAAGFTPGNANNTIRFDAVGASLRLYINGTLVATATDSTFAVGSIGLRGLVGAQYSSYRAAPVTPVALPFADNFTTDPVGPLASSWFTQQGTVAISSGNAIATGSGKNIAVLNSDPATDVSVSAAVTTLPNGGFAGLVARYQGTGDTNMYQAGLRNTSGTYTAEIYVNQHGTWTNLANVNIGGNPGSTFTMRFDVVGTSLKLFVNNIQSASVTDATLASGVTGIRLFQNVALSSFGATAVPNIATQAANLPFSDSLTTAGSLSPTWEVKAGAYTITGGAAVAQNTGANVAVLNGIATGDTTESVTVTNLLSGQFAALVARYQGAGDSGMYQAGVRNTGGALTAEIYKNVAGTWTALTIVSATGFTPGNVRNTIRFDAIGSSLRLYVNGAVVAVATDSTFAVGTLGLRGLQGTEFSSYSAAAVVPVASPYSEDFTSEPNGPLSSNWFTQLGSLAISAGNAIGTGSGKNIAVLNADPTADVSVSATVTALPSAGFAALVARYQGTGDTNMYQAGVRNTGGNYTAEIYVHVNGTWTNLANVPIANPGSSFTLRFDVVGTSLWLFVNGTQVTSASDATIASGVTGVRLFQNVRLSSFATTVGHEPDELIRNGDFEEGNREFQTNYRYSPGNILDTLTYDIVKDPKTSQVYATSFADHTNGKGYMLAVNGDDRNGPDQLVWAQTVAVRSGVDYTFRLWLASWYPLTPAELDVHINGESIGSIVAPSMSGQWTEFKVQWNSGSGISARIEIYDLTHAFSGNDFAIDDVSLRGPSALPGG